MEHPNETRDPLSAKRRDSVARDLDAIFVDRSSTPRATGMVKTVETRRRRWLRPIVISIGALVLAGATAGVALLVGDVLPMRPNMAAPKIDVVRRAPPQPRPPVVAADPIRTTSDTASATSVIAPSPVTPATRTSAPLRETRIPVARSASLARSVADRRPARLADRCDELRDEERAWCMRPNVLAAHRQLRSTYNAARRAGVDSDALARIQGRWTNLQRRAADRPDDTLDGYRDLQKQLLDLIDEQRSAGNDW